MNTIQHSAILAALLHYYGDQLRTALAKFPNTLQRVQNFLDENGGYSFGQAITDLPDLAALLTVLEFINTTGPNPEVCIKKDYTSSTDEGAKHIPTILNDIAKEMFSGREFGVLTEKEKVQVENHFDNWYIMAGQFFDELLTKLMKLETA